LHLVGDLFEFELKLYYKILHVHAVQNIYKTHIDNTRTTQFYKVHITSKS